MEKTKPNVVIDVKNEQMFATIYTPSLEDLEDFSSVLMGNYLMIIGGKNRQNNIRMWKNICWI